MNTVTSSSKGLDDKNENKIIPTSTLTRPQWERRLNNCIILMSDGRTHGDSGAI